MADTLPAPPADLLHGAALFLDFDGTLVEIAERHDGVLVDDRLKALVPALARALGGRLAIVSGRAVDDIARLLGVDPAAPGFAIGGSHGLETLWPDGRRQAPERTPDLDHAVAMIEADAGRWPGVVIEPKPFGVTVHYRQAPDRRADCEALVDRAAAGTGLVVQHGKMVCELKIGGADKGDAVRTFLAAAPMIGAAPVFVGDDLTDEAGFRAAAASGGAGILVGTRDETAARYALPDVVAVLGWLDAHAA